MLRKVLNEGLVLRSDGQATFQQAEQGELMTTGTTIISDMIYLGGDIITMDENNPMAEAVAVKDGLILAVGPKDDVLKTKGAATQIVNLGGKTMLPGFIDGHSHFFQAAMIADYANVSARSEEHTSELQSLR